MNGEIDFAAALRERVALLRGLGLEALERTWAATRADAGRARRWSPPCAPMGH